ncbi:unnamed protein product [Aphanomyces euteiches]
MTGNVDRVDCQWPSQLKLRPYQEEGVAWLHFLASHNLHGILADDMGLGKTLQVLSSVVFLRRQDNDLKDFCTLVICPPLVASHWVREVETYFSDDFPRIVVYTGTTAQRKVLRRQHYHSTKYWSAELVVVSYSVLQHDREYFDQQNFTFCIADEVHLCRNPLSLTSQALFALKATYRIALSGTPIQNSAVDIWSVFSFLMPGLLGDYATFKRHTVQPILLSRGDTATAAQKEAGALALTQLHAKIAPFVMRRTKNAVLTDLPPKVIQDIPCPLSPLQRQLQRQQICIHPALVDPKHATQAAGKLDALTELVQLIQGGGHRCLIFCHTPTNVQFVQQHLRACLPDVSTMKLDGSVPPAQRSEVVDSFNNERATDVLILTTSIGGLGLNLVSADTVVFVEHSWNPFVDLQAMDRVHRLGQLNAVTVYRLLAQDTIEDEILNAQRFKQAMADTVLGPNETKSGNNILQVLQSGFDQNQPPPKKRRRAKPGVQGLLDELEELWDTAHRLTRNSWSVDPHLLEAFLAEDNLRFINGGLQRHDIEQLLRDVERWECTICAFQNVIQQPTCSLCHTQQGVKLIEPFQRDVVHSILGDNSSYIGSTMAKYPLKSTTSMSTSFARGPPISTARRYPKSSSFRQTASRIVHWTSLLHHALLPEDLSPQQRSARYFFILIVVPMICRMRRQWTRKMDPQNHQVVWVRHFIDSEDFPLAYIIQVNPPQDMKICFELAVSNEPIELRTMQRVKSPIQSSLADQIAWTPVELVDGNRSVIGLQPAAEAWAGLLEVSKLAFTLKYAWFLDQVSSLIVPYEERHIRFKVSRIQVLEEAIVRMNELNGRSLCAIARVHFVGEMGQDAGAILREWYVIVAQAFMDPATGLFILANKDDNSYIINPNSGYDIQQYKLLDVDHLEAFHAVGRFIGRAFLDGQMLALPLNPMLFKGRHCMKIVINLSMTAMLGVPMTLDDIESLDRSVYKSLRYLLENEHVDVLALTFSVTEMRGASMVEVDLIDNGSLIDVTDDNKHDYVDLMMRYLLFKRFEPQLLALIQGIYDIVPPELLIPFDHKELELLLCGLSEIDVADWKANTTVSSSLKQSVVLEWFWEIVEAMTLAEKAKLLQYTTGSTRVPVQGFKGLTSHDGRICHFTLKGITHKPGLYPVVHACFNRIDLPIYPDKTQLEDAIRMLLLSEPTGFDIS